MSLGLALLGTVWLAMGLNGSGVMTQHDQWQAATGLLLVLLGVVSEVFDRD